MKINDSRGFTSLFYTLLYTTMLAAAFLGFATAASAQTCNATAVDPVIAAEGYTEMAGDYIVTCTGGVATLAGQPVPAVTITLSTNSVITSKITDGGANSPAFTEALLIVDDPNTSFNNSTASPNILNHPILACGSGNSSFDPSTIGVCDVLGTGNPDTIYDGNNVVGGAARPNIFQGQQVPGSNNSEIQFIGVPFDPAPGGKIHTFRITNVRLNGVAASGGGSVTLNILNPVQVQAFVSITSGSNLVVQTDTLPIATVRDGLVQPPTGVTGGSYPQCGSAAQVSGGSLTVTEGYASSFKPRNWAQIQANGAWTGGADWMYTSGSTPVVNSPDLNQDVPGVFYSTESGLMFPGLTSVSDPPVNPPSGISASPGTSVSTSQNFTVTSPDTGLVSVGQASNGTRLAFVFSTIPTGSNATVPTVIPLLNTGGTQTGVMVYVAGADANGAGGAPSLTGPTSGSTVPLTEPGPIAVFYEVIFADYTQVESATVPVTLNPSVSGNAQAGVIAQGVASLAPYYAVGATPNPGISQSLIAGFTDGETGGLPVARFLSNLLPSSAVNLWSFTACPTVPNVVGSAQAVATTAIQTATLVVGAVTTASSSTVGSGSVISEIPVAGTQVNAGSAVNLVVSSGPAAPVQYQLTTAVNPVGTGTVSGAGLYNANAVATVVATPSTGYRFVNWTGPVASATSASTTVPMTVSATVTANFAPISSGTTTTVAAVFGDYGDAVALSAVVGPAGQVLTGSLQFQIAGVNVGPALSVNGAGTYSAHYNIVEGAGNYAITAVLTSTSTIAGSLGSSTLTVNQENVIATPSLKNPQFVEVNSWNGTAVPITLAGSLRAVDQGNAGNLSFATVTVALVPAAGATTINCPVTNNAGALTATCSGVPTNVYTVQWKIAGNAYYAGPPANSTLTVFEPSRPQPRRPYVSDPRFSR